MAPDVLAERALPDLPSARGGRWRWRFVVGIGLSLLLLAAAAVLGWREQQSHREQAAMQAELVIDGIERQLRERLLHLAADLAAHAAASSRADVSDARPPQAHLHASAIRRALVIDAGGRRVDGSAARIPALPPRGDGLQLLPPEPGAGAVLALWDGTPGVRVLAEVDPGWFAELLQGHALAEGAVLNLVHASQRIYARSHDNDAHLGRDLAGAALFSPAHLARGSGRYEEDSVLSGEPRQFVYRRVADTPLAIVIGTPSASIASQTQAFVVVLLLTALVLGGIWLWLLREFGRGERRQAQLLQRLQQAQQLAMVGTWRWRIDADTIEWGGDSARIYGFPAETTEVALDEVLSRMHPDDLKTVTHWLQLARTDPAAVVGLTVEYRVIRDDGSLCWVLGRVETDDHGDARSLFGVQQDVSEQVRVRERLHLAQDMARIGDWEWDVASGRIRWSRTMYDIYGLDPDAFTPDAENAFLRIHPEDRARVQRYGTALVETGEACEAEFRIVRPDGEVRVISARGMRETAADGRIVIRSVQQDVTELAQARDRLREAEEQYRYLFERNPVPMWVFDRDTLAFIAVNDAMLRHYGYGREELLVGSILDIRPPGERARVEASAREATDERPQGQVWTHLRKDGTPLRMAIFTQDIVFDGRPARMVAAQDVTEREANEQRFRLVARATSDAIYDYDVASNHIWWSESFHAAFGLDPDTVVASLGAWESLVHPEDLPRVSASLERALQAADVEEWQEAYRFRRGDGSYAEVVDRGFFVRDESGRAMRMVGGMLDMSEEYRRESDLRLLRRALEATESGILIADVLQPQLPAVYVNQGFLEMTGYSAAEVLGHDSLFLDFDPRDLEVVREIRRCAHEHRELRTLLRIRRKDGSLFWNDFYMAPVLDDAGQVTHMISVSTDVSERQLAEERFRLVTRATSDVVWDWDLLNEVTWRSDNVYSLFGYDRDEIIGSMSGWSALLHPDDRGRVEASIRSAMDSGATGWECDYRLRRKDGSYADVMDRGFLLRDESGRAVRAVGGMLDVTQKNRDAADLRLLRRAVESTDNGIVIADARQPDTPLVYVNPAFEKMTGYAAAECVGRNCRFLQGEDREQIGLDAVRRALHEGEEARAVLRNYRKDGTLFWNELHVAPVRGEDGVVSHYVGVQSDVSHRHHYEQELAHRATHDQLTGLPNRQLLMDRLQQAILNADRYGRKAGVVFIDLDDFKLINDNLDHAAGDQALRIVAERLRTLTRETDTVGRFGGDEFVVVLTEQTDEDGVGQVISRISNALSQPMQIGGIEHTLTPSIGWSRYPDGGRDPETLLKHADMAMYQAKRRGRNQAVAYSPELDVQASQRLQLLAQLRDALQREEFVLAFQPLFDRDGRAVALEALVRWQHPERGLLLPGEFIGVCEESGLIIELGRLVLREAARHHPLLVAAGHGGVRLAVNVSALQFGYALEHDIAVVMEEFALPRGILEIEITESVIMENPDRAIEAMRRISALGVCLSVDDFGTGYSSLTYLKRLPIHRLKIDRSFVQDLPADQEAASICDSIIGLAHSLGLKTVGEGVETEAQLKWLRGNGCDEVQGYLMARPAPFDEVLCLLSANRCSSTA